VDEHSMDHPFVENDESMDDESEERQKRRRWPVVVVLGRHRHRRDRRRALRRGEPLSTAIADPLRRIRFPSPDVQRNTRDESQSRARATSCDRTERVIPVEVIVTLNNVQRFPVTIDKVSAPANPSGTSNVRAYFDSTPKLTGAYGYKGGPAFTPTTSRARVSSSSSSTGSRVRANVGGEWRDDLHESARRVHVHEFSPHGDGAIDTLTISPRATC